MQEAAHSSARTKRARRADVRRAAPIIVPIAQGANPNKIQRFAIKQLALKRSLTVVAGATTIALAASIFCVATADAASEIQSFRDCTQCPEMVQVPSGTFLMGPQPGEEEDEQVPDDWKGVAGSPRLVNIAADFAVSRFPVTRGQFRAFASAVRIHPEGGLRSLRWRALAARARVELGQDELRADRRSSRCLRELVRCKTLYPVVE